MIIIVFMIKLYFIYSPSSTAQLTYPPVDTVFSNHHQNFGATSALYKITSNHSVLFPSVIFVLQQKIMLMQIDHRRSNRHCLVCCCLWLIGAAICGDIVLGVWWIILYYDTKVRDIFLRDLCTCLNFLHKKLAKKTTHHMLTHKSQHMINHHMFR